MNAIEQGIISTTTKERLIELEASRERLEADLAKVKEPAPSPMLHPRIAEIYRRERSTIRRCGPRRRPHCAAGRVEAGVDRHKLQATVARLEK